MVDNKYILVSVGIDKRTKNLSLTKKGQDLEKKLSAIQIDKIKNIIKFADEKNINGFKIILYEMLEDKNKKKFDEINNL